MSDILKAACIQMNAKPDVNENLSDANVLIRQAAEEGAQFIATPENTDFMRQSAELRLGSSFEEDDHPALPFFSELARDLKIWLLIGSIKIREGNKMYNRSYLFNDKGEVAAHYNKIHLFDVDLPTGESHRESHEIIAGDKAVVAETPWSKVGLSICYDLRFAYLYRALAQKGANILTVPSAFTVPTGQAHWMSLLRARAIETGCFVIAPAQCGSHENGRSTYGHSAIIGPWGEVLAEAGEAPGYITADLDLADIEKARQAIPALQHDREYSF